MWLDSEEKTMINDFKYEIMYPAPVGPMGRFVFCGELIGSLRYNQVNQEPVILQ